MAGSNEVDGTRIGVWPRVRYERCVECGLSFPITEMQEFRGKWYGVSCGDHTDIQDILLKERMVYHQHNKRRGRER